jgi:hypothetical protein
MNLFDPKLPWPHSRSMRIIMELWRLSLTFGTRTGAMESNPGAVDALIGPLEVHHGAMETYSVKAHP